MNIKNLTSKISETMSYESTTANQKNDDIPEEDTIEQFYKQSYEEYKYLDKTDEPTNAELYQLKLKATIKKLEKVTQLVSALDVFSKNEDYKDISPDALKYLLLPYLLGGLTLRLQLQDRMNILEVAEIYFKDFLQRCHLYGIGSYKIPEEAENEHNMNDHKAQSFDRFQHLETLAEAAHRRSAKIQRFKELQAVQQQIENLEHYMNRDIVDDDVKRDYYSSQLKAACNKTIDELEGILAEKSILKQRLKQKLHDEKSPRRKSSELRPFIITRTAAEKKIFGAGYPSLPILSIEDFYDDRVKKGLFPNPIPHADSCLKSKPQEMKFKLDNQEQDQNEESDEDEKLQKDRAWSEWHDEHRIGYGNTKNKG